MNQAEPRSDSRLSPRRHRCRILLIATGALVVLLLIGVGVYGLLRGPDTGSDPARTGPGTASPSNPAPTAPTDPTGTASPATLSPVVATVDPEVFARRVAVAVFGWDTTTGYDPSDYIQRVVNVGDPSGRETPGLAADLDTYLPDTAAWVQLRTYRTRQWLTVDTTVVPSSWPQALQEARGTLRAGTAAYTITGVRHRAGIWDNKPVTTTGRVSFTVFETCQPTYATCRLLRLSQLDTPLP
jgi:hypothetical protein